MNKNVTFSQKIVKTHQIFFFINFQTNERTAVLRPEDASNRVNRSLVAGVLGVVFCSFSDGSTNWQNKGMDSLEEQT